MVVYELNEPAFGPRCRNITNAGTFKSPVGDKLRMVSTAELETTNSVAKRIRPVSGRMVILFMSASNVMGCEYSSLLFFVLKKIIHRIRQEI